MSNDIHYGRNRKGIKKELTQQVSDWLETIEDIDVKVQARQNCIVTGGSIASMLLGESVNDYDIYFRDIETTKMVAEYYVKQFNEENDRNYKVTTDNLLNIKNERETRVIIQIPSSGVAEADDVDDDSSLPFGGQPKPKKKSHRPIFLSENAITLSDSFQLVSRFYGEPDEIHDNYDFEHAKCYWDHENRELELPSSALENLLSRTLIYTGSLYPVASIFRMKKFINRGWRITAGQQLKIMWQISEIDLSDPKVMREQLTGVDQAYMWELLQALEGLSPELITSTYVGGIIDKIFE